MVSATTSGSDDTATFNLNNQLEVTASVVAGAGTISPATQNVDSGGVAEFTVSPAADWNVDEVTGDTCVPAQVSGNAWEATNIQANCVVGASFVINSYTVTAAVGAGNGQVSPDSQEVDHGSSASFTVTPDTGWSVSTVTGDSCSPEFDGGTLWIATDITGACAVTANFSINSYTIGGTVSGLGGSGLVLQNNGGDDLQLSANGDFSFATALDDLSDYAVTVSSQPDGQQCSVDNANGTLDGGDVEDVAVNCADIDLGLSVADIEFTNLEPGETEEQTQSLTLSNTSSADLVVEEFVAPTEPFGFDPMDCAPLPYTLAPGESCTAKLSFTPGDAGDFSDQLLIVSNALDSPTRVTLTASHTVPATPIPTLGLLGLMSLLLGMLLIGMQRIHLNSAHG